MRTLVLAFLLCCAATASAQIDDERVDTSRIAVDTTTRATKVRKPLKLTNAFLGSDIGLSFSTGFFVNISPYAGYKIANRLALGGGFTYMYYYNFRSTQALNVYGLRAMMRIRPFTEPIPGLGGLHMAYFQAEAEEFWVKYPTQPISAPITAVNVGLGYSSAFAQRWGFTMSILYNIMYSPGNSIFSSPVSYKLGVWYGFP